MCFFLLSEWEDWDIISSWWHKMVYLHAQSLTERMWWSFKVAFLNLQWQVLARTELTFLRVSSMGLRFDLWWKQGCFSYCWAGLAQQGFFCTSPHLSTKAAGGAPGDRRGHIWDSWFQLTRRVLQTIWCHPHICGAWGKSEKGGTFRVMTLVIHLGLTSNQNPSPTQLLTHSPTSRTREKIGRIKAGKIMGWDKNSLIGKVKATCRNKAKQGINPRLPMGR